MKQPCDVDRGFVLLDSLLALGLLAIMTGLLFETIASTALARRTLADRRAAIAVAQSALATLQARRQNDQVVQTGLAGYYRWSAQVARWQGAATPNSVAIEQVTVTVARDDDKKVLARLTSLRLAR